MIDGPSNNEDMKRLFNLSLQVSLTIMNLQLVVSEAFIRRNFCLRYFTMPKVLLACIAFFAFALFVSPSVNGNPPEVIKANIYFIVLFVAVSMVHLVIAWRHKPTNPDQWLHTRYYGDSIPMVNRNPLVAHLLIEPMLLLVIGGILTRHPLTLVIGIWLLLSIPTFIGREIVLQYQMLIKIFDSLDNQVEQQQLAAAITKYNSPSSKATRGVVFPYIMKEQSSEERARMAHTMGILPPGFEQLLDQPLVSLPGLPLSPIVSAVYTEQGNQSAQVPVEDPEKLMSEVTNT